MYDNIYEVTRRECEVRLCDGTYLSIHADEHNFTVFYRNETSNIVWEEAVKDSPLEALAKLIFKEVENGR